MQVQFTCECGHWRGTQRRKLSGPFSAGKHEKALIFWGSRQKPCRRLARMDFCAKKLDFIEFSARSDSNWFTALPGTPARGKEPDGIRDESPLGSADKAARNGSGAPR